MDNLVRGMKTRNCKSQPRWLTYQNYPHYEGGECSTVTSDSDNERYSHNKLTRVNQNPPGSHTAHRDCQEEDNEKEEEEEGKKE